MTTYTIGEFAKKIGKSSKTLREWDKKGILPAHRTPTNRRYYTHDQYLEISGKTKYKRDGSDLDAVRGKVVLITGGTGSLGHALTERICDAAKKVIIFSRCELKQARMRQKFADKKNIRYMIGDIRDKSRLITALGNVDVCIHAACMKRVETCTYNAIEAVKSNVIGSVNVLEACIENEVSRALLVSTDKACLDYHSYVTLYDGSTKKIGEIVDNKEDVEVLSFDSEKGIYVPGKITGWFKNKRQGRDYFDVTFKNARRYSNNRVRARVTGDHKFLTKNRGWVEAQHLEESDLLVTDYLVPNHKQMSLLVGLLLGDGNILYKEGKNKNSSKAIFRYGQSEDKVESVTLFKKALQTLGTNDIRVQESNRGRQRFHTFSLKATPFMSGIYKEFYPNGKKIIPKSLVEKYFSPIMLSAWINDDGCKSYGNLRIATHSFEKEDVFWMADFLTSKGLECWSYPCEYKDKTYYELRFSVKATNKISNMISGYLPHCSLHKLYNCDALNSKLWQLGDPTPFVDNPIIKISERKTKFVYCIQVEKTHNFVSSGMVLHNCAPATLYGGTKFVAEQIFINGNNYSARDKTIFTCTRYGNVYGSNGSVRHLFEQQAKDEGRVSVTHEDMTRFFMSMDEAVDLNLFALNNTIGGEIFIPKLKATTIMAFANTFAPGVPVRFIGLRGYEKIHEDLISKTEMLYTVDCGKYFKIVPPGVNDWTLGWDVSYPEEPKVDSFEYTSDQVEQFTEEELRKFDK